MADLIGIGDFENAGGDVASVAADMAMSAASEMVRNYLNQTISLVENDVVTLAGTGSRALILPELPVVAINSVTVNGTAVAASGYREERGVLWRLSPTEVDDGEVLTSVWTRGYDVVVDYDHGWETIPADIKLVTARLAVSIATDAVSTPGLRQEAIQDYSYSRADTSQAFAAELAVIGRRAVRQVPVP